jgi:hypothetical protein
MARPDQFSINSPVQRQRRSADMESGNCSQNWMERIGEEMVRGIGGAGVLSVVPPREFCSADVQEFVIGSPE